MDQRGNKPILRFRNICKQTSGRTFRLLSRVDNISRPDGLFFGGTGETWSNKTLKTIMSQPLTSAFNHLASSTYILASSRRGMASLSTRKGISRNI
jgi:hypothetical protein